MSGFVRHTCHATNCGERVPPKMFMCKRHWFMLPKAMRLRVWALYRPGQEVDKRPSEEYLAHTQACIEYVAEQEEAYARSREKRGR